MYQKHDELGREVIQILRWGRAKKNLPSFVILSFEYRGTDIQLGTSLYTNGVVGFVDLICKKFNRYAYRRGSAH